MTALEMQYNILLQIDSLFEGTAPGYNTLQIGSIMNRAQRRVFNEKKMLYDTDEHVKRMLAPLNRRASTSDNTIKVTTLALRVYMHPNGVYYSLPANTGYITEEYVNITPVVGAAITKPVLVKPITYDYYLKNYENRYKKPSSEIIWRLDYNYDSAQTGYIVELVTDGSTITKYQIAYLKYPQNMVIGTTNCEIIDESFHDDIVSESVKMITAALNDEGYSVAVNEANSDK